MKSVMVVLFLFFCTDTVFAQGGKWAKNDNNQYIVVAQQFEVFLLKHCELEKANDEFAQYSCADTTQSLPAGFQATVIKNKEYWQIFVVDNSRLSSFLTVLEAPLFLNSKTPALFYAPKSEVLGKMREVIALLPEDEEVRPQVAYDVDLRP